MAFYSNEVIFKFGEEANKTMVTLSRLVFHRLRFFVSLLFN